jgi:hypothetical protein
MKAMGTQIAELQEQNRILLKTVANRPLTPTTKALEDAAIMSKVDKKVATVNDRVSEVVSKFEAFINNNAKNALPNPPTQSHNIINAH